PVRNSGDAHVTCPFPLRAPQPHRNAYWLRYDELRSLNDPARWQGGEILHDPRSASRRSRTADGRRPRARWQAPSDSRGLHRRAWPPVRLLHARNDDVLRRSAPEKSASNGGTVPPRDLRELVPMHGLREYREGDPTRREQDGRPFGRRTTMTVHAGRGQSMQRQAGARFVRGTANYLDDVNLPAMLHLNVVRRPPAP